MSQQEEFVHYQNYLISKGVDDSLIAPSEFHEKSFTLSFYSSGNLISQLHFVNDESANAFVKKIRFW